MGYQHEIDERMMQLMVRDSLYQQFLDKTKTLYQTEHDFDEWLKLKEQLDQKWHVRMWTFRAGKPMKVVSIEIAQPKVREFVPWRKELFGPEQEFLVKDEEGDVFAREPGHLYIDIDLRTLDQSDNSKVKEQVWEIVKLHLSESEKKSKIPPLPKELRPIFHCKDETFQNYLRWYDIHTREKLGFRLIAFLENKLRDGLKSYDEWIEKLRTTKWKVGKEYIKGEDSISEDAVEKAVKQIWTAIRREPYTPIKKELEDWTCPIHGRTVQTLSDPGHIQPHGPLIIECEHCKALYDKFEHINSMNKGYVLTVADLVDEIIYIRTGRLPRKSGSRRTDEE